MRSTTRAQHNTRHVLQHSTSATLLLTPYVDGHGVKEGFPVCLVAELLGALSQDSSQPIHACSNGLQPLWTMVDSVQGRDVG